MLNETQLCDKTERGQKDGSFGKSIELIKMLNMVARVCDPTAGEVEQENPHGKLAN